MIPQYTPLYNRKVIAKEIEKYVLGDNFFSENLKTKEFEEAIAKILGVKHCVTVTNGTMALALALLAEGVRPGDRVLIPNITMMSTQASVELIGAIPVFIDVDVNNLCMDLQKAKSNIMIWDVKAVIYVSLNGRTHPIEELEAFEHYCVKLGVKYIEDNAQSFGSKLSNDETFVSCPMVGIGCFSMSFHKLLSAGQGGFLVTDEYHLAKRLRELKNVGRVEGGADVHERFGINNKFTDIQAIIGLVGLQDIERNIQLKKTNFSIYRNQLENLDEIAFLPTNLTYVTPWFMDAFVMDREGLMNYLKEKGIGTRAIYPELTSQKLNKRLFRPTSLKISGKATSKGLWLPSSLNLTLSQITYVCDKIKEYYGY